MHCRHPLHQTSFHQSGNEQLRECCVPKSKKRIDKANIKGTAERITTPGKIAIIYSSEYDELMYSKYIKYLEDKGYLKKNSSEVVDVENLQGITGLKALRVEINYGDTQLQSAFDIKDILESIKKN